MTAICTKCGRDCVTQLALGKHMVKQHPPDTLEQIEACDTTKFTFSDRHITKGSEKCPRCLEIWADFLIIDEFTWACLSCGCHFMPRSKMNEVNDWKLKDAESKRQAARTAQN